ncbi:MAG: GNAT family N-acetyltransferase [Litorilinea sp.]
MIENLSAEPNQFELKSMMFSYCEMQEADIPEVSGMVMRLFHNYIADDFPARSRTGIRQYLSAQALYARHNFHHFALVCRLNSSASIWPQTKSYTDSSGTGVLWHASVSDSPPIVGVIEVREHRHISLLFVDDAHQRRGIGRALVANAVARCRRKRPGLTEITVRAAPGAVPVYARLGFHPDRARDEDDSPALAMRLGLS